MSTPAGRHFPSLSSVVLWSTCVLVRAALALSLPVTVLQAADICPVAKITGPVTGGAASAAVPLEVPQFRTGLTPRVDLTYSSAGASGWLGRGWDLEPGSIQKRGRPGYERYYYVVGDDVRELVRVNTEYGQNGQWKYEYYVLKHNRPAGKLCREGDTGEKLYSTWYGTLNGLKHTFGRWASDASRSGQATNAYHTGDDDDAFVEKWGLLSVKDLNDNHMSIGYDRYYDWNRYVYYPKTVSYGTRSGTIYSVYFSLDNNTKLLDYLQVKNGDREITRYEFAYDCSADTRYMRLRSVARSAFGKFQPPIELDWTCLSDISPYCDYLHTIDNGQGGLITYEYTPYTYAPGKKVAVLAKVTTDNGRGSETRTGYTYTHGAVNSYDSLIFKQVSATRPDLSTVTARFIQGDGAMAGLPESYEQSGPIALKAGYSWSERNGTVRLDSKTTRYYSPATGSLSGSPTVISFHHDDIYQFVKEVEFSGPGRNKIIYNYTWEDRLKAIETNPKFFWLQPTGIAVSEMVGGTKKLQRKNEFRYNDKGRMSKVLAYVTGTVKAATEVTKFDACGNPLEVKDPNGNITTLEYDDPLKLYPKKITAPNGLSTSKTYDYDRFGRIKTSRDANGNETSYAYDAFGRLEYAYYPDGGTERLTYTDHDYSTGVPGSVRREVNVGGAWEFASKEYRDGFGNVVQSVRPVGAGSYAVTGTHYDYAGRAGYVIGPYSAGTTDFIAAPYLSGYCDFGIKGCLRRWIAYDGKGRLASVRKSINQKYPWFTETADTIYEYPDLRTVKITDPDGKVSCETLDDIGRIIGKTDGNGSPTSYTYNAAGDLTSVTGPLGDRSKATFAYDLRGMRTSMKGPAGDSWTYPLYDKNGNLRQEIGPAGETVNYTYDVMNRITRIEYLKAGAQTKTIDYTYDNPNVTNGKGRAYTSYHSDGVGYTYNYDRMGRVTKEDKTMSLSPFSFPITYSTSYAYDTAGRLDSITHPDGSVVYYDYVPGSQLISRVTLPNSDWADFAYHPGGTIESSTYRNGTRTGYDYYPESARLKSLSTTNSGGAALQGWEYTYYNSGDLRTKKDLVNGKTLTYSYDNVHRLLGEASSMPNDSYAYKYDSGGNITERSQPYQTFTYGYDADRPYLLANVASAPESRAVTSDRSGNITGQPVFLPSPRRLASYAGDGKASKIDYAGIEAATVSFVYEPNGDRAAKSKYTFKTSSLKDWNHYVSPGYMVDRFAKIKYFSAGARKIAKMDGNGNVVWFSHDHLGSTTMVTNAAGGKLESTEYAPFGAIRQGSSALVNTDYMYTGQEYDREEMLYYYRSRLYDPAIGRFMTPDAVIPDLFGPKALHPYSYVGNNPLRYTDPTGQVWEDEIDQSQRHLLHIVALFAGGHVEPGTPYEEALRNRWAQAYENVFVLRMRRWAGQLARGFYDEALRLRANNTVQDFFDAFLWDVRANHVLTRLNAMNLPAHIHLPVIPTGEPAAQMTMRVAGAEAGILQNAMTATGVADLEAFFNLVFANPVGADGHDLRTRLRLTMPERLPFPVQPVNMNGHVDRLY